MLLNRQVALIENSTASRFCAYTGSTLHPDKENADMQDIGPCRLGIVCEIRGGGFEWFCAQVYDCRGQCLCQCCCPSSGTQWLTVPIPGEYKIRVSAGPYGQVNPLCAYRWVHVVRSAPVIEHFVFSRHPSVCMRVCFTLKDAAYPDLPIEGGTLFLWPNTL